MRITRKKNPAGGMSLIARKSTDYQSIVARIVAAWSMWHLLKDIGGAKLMN